MALIRCPECGTKISDLAQFCPNCGRQNDASTQINEYENYLRIESVSDDQITYVSNVSDYVFIDVNAVVLVEYENTSGKEEQQSFNYALGTMGPGDRREISSDALQQKIEELGWDVLRTTGTFVDSLTWKDKHH